MVWTKKKKTNPNDWKREIKALILTKLRQGWASGYASFYTVYANVCFVALKKIAQEAADHMMVPVLIQESEAL